MDPSLITLRRFELSDADDMLRWAGDERVTNSLRWKTLTSKEEASDFIQQACIPHPWRRSICVNGRSVGFVSVFPGSGDDRFRADIGYAVSAEHWGKGVATRAVKMAGAEVFENFPELVRLQAFADVGNTASHKVLERAGFAREGTLRKYACIKGRILDVVAFSLLSTDLLID